MSKVKSITLGDKDHASVLIVPKRTKKKWVLNFYSLEGKGVEKQIGLMSTKGLKDNLLFKLKFRSMASLESMMTVLRVVRDKAIFHSGWIAATKNNELKNMLANLSTEDLAKITEAMVVEKNRRFPSEWKEQEKKKEQQPEAVVNQQ